MKKILFTVLFFVCLFSQAKNYYMRSDGSNSNTGLSDAQAWKDFSKLEAAAFVAGDTIFFKRGQTFVVDAILYTEGGSVGNPVVFTAYGIGAKPIITSYGSVPGWNVSGNWTNVEGNVWYIQLGVYYGYNRVWINGVEQTRVAADNDVNVTSITTWNYHWSDKLYIYSVGNPATTFTNIEVNTLDKLFHCDYSNIVFSYLDLQAAHHCIRISNGADNFVIDSCNIGWNCDGRGILISNSSDGLSCDNGIISNCSFISNWEIPYNNIEINSAFAGINMNYGINSWLIHDNYFENWGHGGVDIDNLSTASRRTSNIKVYNNYITAPDIYYGRGIGLGYYYGDSCEVYNNYVYKCGTQTQLNGKNLLVYNNVIDAAGKESDIIIKPYATGAGISINNGGPTDVSGMKVYNNVIANTYDYGIDFGPEDDVQTYTGCTFINNIVYNCGSSARSSNYQMRIYDQVSMGANTYKNNLLYKSGVTDVIYYGNDAANDYPHTVAEFNAETGTDGDIISGNIQHNPLFVSTTDFNLGAKSPAIDSGINVGLPYLGSYPDRGAYEYSVNYNGGSILRSYGKIIKY